MTAIASRYYEPVLPDDTDRELAKKSSRSLVRHVQKHGEVHLSFVEKGKKVESVVLPKTAFKILVDLLAEMARGNAVTLIPVHAELTTQQGAEILQVSRPFLIGLLQQGKIRFRKVGSHRRILFKDLIAYRQAIDATRERSLDALARQAQDLKMGY
ncbi:MAG: helix-turn-helix domain-containing protein [Opitutaceae bacterium]|nr:helix-turn-helix domain-containing protein [Opitutaceae bacterium]